MTLCPTWACFDALVSVGIPVVDDGGSHTMTLQRPLIRCVVSHRYANCLALHLLASRSTAELFGAGAFLLKRFHCVLYLCCLCMMCI